MEGGGAQCAPPQFWGAPKSPVEIIGLILLRAPYNSKLIQVSVQTQMTFKALKLAKENINLDFADQNNADQKQFECLKFEQSYQIYKEPFWLIYD